MDRYIGMDVHATSCTVVAIDATGRKLKSLVVETNGEAIVEAIRAIAGSRHVCLEEGTQSAWLYEILEPHCEQVVVSGVEESRGPKNDERDAWALAEKLRTGAIKAQVFKPVGQFGVLRELSRAYSMVSRDVVRTQLRIKALFRSRGVPTAGKGVYSPKQRDAWMQKLGDGPRRAVTTLYAEYDGLLEVKESAQKQLLTEAKKHPIAKVLETCPGLGPVRVARMLPVVVTPHRFRTKRQFWSYCGLGIVMRSSSDWVRTEQGQWSRAQVLATRGLTRRFNHTLKEVFKNAATTVVTQGHDDPLYADYQRMLKAGTKPNLAKLTLARKIAAISLAVWKHEEAYDPKKYRTQSS